VDVPTIPALPIPFVTAEPTANFFVRRVISESRCLSSLTNMPMVGSSPTERHKNLIVGTGPRDHRNLQRGVAHTDAFSLFDSDLEHVGTAVFTGNCPWQAKTKLCASAVFATFSMTYDRPALHFEYLGRLAQNSDRCSSCFRSLVEGIVFAFRAPDCPLKYPSRNHAYTSGTRFLSVDFGQYGEWRQNMR
jgi:hypothetical protein